MHSDVLVTGCNGFVGRHLTETLRQRGLRVCGLDLSPEPWADWIEYRSTDIGDVDAVYNFVSRHRPSSIYHLAAVANPRVAHDRPLDAVRTNILGTATFYEMSRNFPEIRLLVVGSSEEYARGRGNILHLDEGAEVDASSIYGMTKLCAEQAGLAYVRQFGCQIVFTRSFNHTGPWQSSTYVLSSFARQCAEIARGKRDPVIRVGNIDVRRDFLDIADVISAYQLIVEKGIPGEVYNVCASHAYTLRELLDTLITLTERHDIRVERDPQQERAGEPEIIEGDGTRLREQTGWRPLVDIRDSLRRLYEYWYEKEGS
jgi:GDP-4-dehydro-6-deoxy-D-mannose reductase